MLVGEGSVLETSNTAEISALSDRYWGELWPDSPTYARLSNLLYAAEPCTEIKENKVLRPYVNSPCHKVAQC